jgi:excisionase family DNA binding protein
MAEPLLISVNDALTATGLGRTKLFELMASNQIESVRVGSRRLLPYAAVFDFVERLREEARAEAGFDIN